MSNKSIDKTYISNLQDRSRVDSRVRESQLWNPNDNSTLSGGPNSGYLSKANINNITGLSETRYEMNSP